MLVISEQVVIPDEEIVWTYARSGGPGGQNVNKVASKATLRWALSHSVLPEVVKGRLRTSHPSRVTESGEFLVVSQKYRDQERNREDCLEKLAGFVRAALQVPKSRRPTKPTRGSQRRRLEEKRHNAERKSNRKVDD